MRKVRELKVTVTEEVLRTKTPVGAGVMEATLLVTDAEVAVGWIVVVFVKDKKGLSFTS